MSIDLLHFTPLRSLAGGLLIGAAASLLALGLGRIAGISGILSTALRPAAATRGWPLAFCAGLLLAPWLWRLFRPWPAVHLSLGSGGLILAGLLVGYGVRLGGGCTSGHGVCGLSRGSPRSMLATASFMLAGLVTTLLSRHVLPGLWP